MTNAPFIYKALSGMTAGGVGQAIAVPCDLIKVRMQGDGRLVAAGKLDKPRYTGLMDAFVKIKAEEGIAGFYKGATPAIQRAALVNLGELTTCAHRRAVRRAALLCRCAQLPAHAPARAPRPAHAPSCPPAQL